MNNDLKQLAADACVQFYMATHISELKYTPAELKKIWWIGQNLYAGRINMRDAARNCPDCGAEQGEQHLDDCDVEQCPDCGGQMISCFCEGSIEMPRLDWTGEFPGVLECREFGWYAKMVSGHGWVPCDKNEPGASEDLNRLAANAVWDKKQGRYKLDVIDENKHN